MRHVIYKDTKITQAAFDKWKAEDISFWQAIGITPWYWVIEQDFSDYPVEADYDGDARPAKAFVKSLTDNVYTKYGQDGADFIMLLVHDSNWKSSGDLFNAWKKTQGITKEKGIWGTNVSNVYYNYHVQYCRWDSKNPANTFGTLYHERHHALDALIATETGINVNPLINVKAWDSGCTHGGEFPWHYIRHKENAGSVEKIRVELKAALKKRQDRHDEYIKGTKLTIIKLLEQLVYLWRKTLNKKNGVTNQ